MYTRFEIENHLNTLKGDAAINKTMGNYGRADKIEKTIDVITQLLTHGVPTDTDNQTILTNISPQCDAGKGV